MAKEEKAVKPVKKIRVKALRMGYINHVRQREGSIFVIPENRFSSRWMEKVEAKKPEKIEEEVAEDFDQAPPADEGEKKNAPASTGDEEVI